MICIVGIIYIINQNSVSKYNIIFLKSCYYLIIVNCEVYINSF